MHHHKAVRCPEIGKLLILISRHLGKHRPLQMNHLIV